MSTDANKELVRRYIQDVFTSGNLAAVDQLLSRDVIDHNPVAGAAPGLESIKAAVVMLRSAFPDLHYTIEDMVAEEHFVAGRFTVRGSHRGPLLGIPASNKGITVNSMVVVRIREGKIVERSGVMDIVGILQQIGVMPRPDNR